VASSSRILKIASVLKRSSIFAGLTYKKKTSIHSGALFILKERKKKETKQIFWVCFVSQYRFTARSAKKYERRQKTTGEKA